MLLCLSVFSSAESQAVVQIDLDTTEVPELNDWGICAQKTLEDWHPKISSLLANPRVTVPSKISLQLKKSEVGVGATSGTHIVVFSGWINKHPEDLGLVVHELVHVIQHYPNPQPLWITEGIADYIRWAIYEKKPQHSFPLPQGPEDYKQGYRMTAGFFLWLETHESPGIVSKLNLSMQDSSYRPQLFELVTGHDLPTLWERYSEAQRKAVSTETKK